MVEWSKRKGEGKEWHTIYRHDLSDAARERLEGDSPGCKGIWGGIARDKRKFVRGVFWILRTGASWRDLPSDYGG